MTESTNENQLFLAYARSLAIPSGLRVPTCSCSISRHHHTPPIHHDVQLSPSFDSEVFQLKSSAFLLLGMGISYLSSEWNLLFRYPCVGHYSFSDSSSRSKTIYLHIHKALPVSSSGCLVFRSESEAGCSLWQNPECNHLEAACSCASVPYLEFKDLEFCWSGICKLERCLLNLSKFLLLFVIANVEVSEHFTSLRGCPHEKTRIQKMPSSGRHYQSQGYGQVFAEFSVAAKMPKWRRLL